MNNPEFELEVFGETPISAAEKAVRDAEEEVRRLSEEEIDRRQWCVQAALQSWTLEASENNFIRVANKIYEYVYGTRP